MNTSSTAFLIRLPLVRQIPRSLPRIQPRRPSHTVTINMAASKMFGIYMDQYGPPDQVLQFKELPRPQLTDDNILVRLQASSVHGGEWRVIRGTPFFIRPFFGGFFKPSKNIPGSDVAGVVQATGKNVQDFKVGDNVFGDVSDINWGAWAQFISVPANAMIKRPSNVALHHAAVTPVSGIPALQAVRDFAKVQKGQSVLVNGASGGVGHFAVQIAKSLGAHVSAVCHRSKMEMVKKCGADRIIDYTEIDVVKEGTKYDSVIDTAAFRSPWEMVNTVKKGGSYVLVGGDMGRLFQTAILGGFISWRTGVDVKVLETKVNKESLEVIRDMLADGRIVPHIDSKFKLENMVQAVQRLEDRTVQGKVVLEIDN